MTFFAIICGRWGKIYKDFTAEDGVRRIKKKVRWTFFPSNRPTKPLCGEETLDHGSKELLGNKKEKTLGISLGFYFFTAEDGT